MGLIPYLKQRYYPRYSYERATYGTGATGASRGSFFGGTRAGSALDRQLGQSIRYAVKHKLTVQQALARANTSHALSVHAKQFWALMVQQGWQPVAAQLPVGCVARRIATAVDVVCRRVSDNAVVLLEIKRGFETYLHKHTNQAMVLHDRTRVTDSPANQHQLQLGGTRELYNSTYGAAPASSAYVVRFHTGGVDVTPLQDWALRVL